MPSHYFPYFSILTSNNPIYFYLFSFARHRHIIMPPFFNFWSFNDPNMSIPALQFNAMHGDVIYWTWMRCAMIDWVNWLNWFMDFIEWMNESSLPPLLEGTWNYDAAEATMYCKRLSWIFELLTPHFFFFFLFLFWFWFFLYCRCKRLTWSAFLIFTLSFSFFLSFDFRILFILFYLNWIFFFFFLLFLERELWWW